MLRFNAETAGARAGAVLPILSIVEQACEANIQTDHTDGKKKKVRASVSCLPRSEKSCASPTRPHYMAQVSLACAFPRQPPMVPPNAGERISCR